MGEQIEQSWAEATWDKPLSVRGGVARGFVVRAGCHHSVSGRMAAWDGAVRGLQSKRRGEWRTLEGSEPAWLAEYAANHWR